MKGKAPEKLVWKQENACVQDWVSRKQGCEGVYTGEMMQMISGINTFGLEERLLGTEPRPHPVVHSALDCCGHSCKQQPGVCSRSASASASA